MSENLSIDEIIKQAEDIRKKSLQKTYSSVEEEAPEETEEVRIKEMTSQAKTTVISREDLTKAAELSSNSQNEKTQVVRVNEKTGVIPDVKNIKPKQKKSFFNNPEYEPVYSKEPPELMERSATVKTKSVLQNTGDLKEIPTIVAVEELEKTRISFNNAEKQPKPDVDEYDDNAQIVLEGFEDATDKVQKIDEELAEEQLRERRQTKIDTFRVFSPDEEAKAKTADRIIKNEYENNDERSEFLDKLYEAKKATAVTTFITLATTIILGALTVFKDSSFMPSVLMETKPFISTVLVIFVVAILFNIKALIRGFRFSNGINSDFPISFVSAFVLIHTALLLFNNDLYLDEGSVYVFAAAFAMLINNIGKYTLLMRIIYNFKYIASKQDKYTVETIVNQIDATIISRGLLTGEPNLKTSIKTDFPTHFLDIACSDEPADTIAQKGGMAMIILNAILFLVIAVMNRSWHIGFNVIACGICISMPCMSLFCTNNALNDLSKLIKKNGACINGYEGANSVVDANAIVIEAQDLFAADSCEIHGILPFNGAKEDDIILKAAAVIINTKSPLAPIFDKVIIGQKNILPEVDSIVYEDRLGTSAWIYRKKVLVGTRELLERHGVEVPTESFEKKHLRKGRKILYLAETGRLMAMFVVSYNADPSLKKALKKLEKTGMTILVKSADPFINDESIAKLFNLPDGYARVMSSANARSFDKYSNMRAERSPAYVTHNGSALGFVTAMSAAENLIETRRMLSVLIIFGCTVGFAVVALLSLFSGFSQLSAVSVVVFQVVWLMFTEFISKLKRHGF